MGTLVAHDTEGLLQAIEHAIQIHVHNIAPLLRRPLQEGARWVATPRVIEKQVHSSKARNCFCKEAFNRKGICDVSGNAKDPFPGAERRVRLCMHFIQKCTAAASKYKTVASARQSECDRFSYARPCAGDYCYFVVVH